MQKHQEETRLGQVNPVATANETSSSIPQRPSSVFSSKQTLHRSLSRADAHLPKIPNKTAENIQRLATQYIPCE